MKYRKIGITGGSGFIGKRLLSRFQDESYETKSFEGNIMNKEDLEGFFDGCDAVVHLAGVFSNNFEQLLEVNVLGTRNVVDACIKSGVKKIIFSSTGAVYGEPLREKSLETDPLHPNTLYGLSKMFAEEYIRFSGINHIILRFPNVYGLGNEKGVIYNFLRSIKEKEKIVIYGTGEQKRDFVFVDDAVHALVLATTRAGISGTFNISGGTAYSLNDIVGLLRERGLSFDVSHEDFEASNALRVLSQSNGRAKEILGWEPSVGLAEGIGRIIGIGK